MIILGLMFDLKKLLLSDQSTFLHNYFDRISLHTPIIFTELSIRKRTKEKREEKGAF